MSPVDSANFDIQEKCMRKFCEALETEQPWTEAYAREVATAMVEFVDATTPVTFIAENLFKAMSQNGRAIALGAIVQAITQLIEHQHEAIKLRRFCSALLVQ